MGRPSIPVVTSATVEEAFKMTKSLVLTLGCLLSASAAMAQPKTKEYDLANANISGDILRCPRTIVAKNLNVLRYDYKFNGAISFSQPVDLWSKLTSVATPPPLPSQPPRPSQPPPPPPPVGVRPLPPPPTCEQGLQASGVSDSAAIQHICAARRIEDTINGRNSTISGIATAVATNYGKFTVLVGAANTATGEVKAGGNALKNF